MPASTTELHKRIPPSGPYSSKIIKAGALIGDTKTLLSHWNFDASVDENIRQVQRDNVFGKASRSRVDAILAILRQRYLTEESVTKALVTLVRKKFACLHRLRSFRPSLSQTSRAATRRRPESLISQGAWPIPGDNRFRGRKITRLRLFLARTRCPGVAMMNFAGRLRRHAVDGSGSITTRLRLGPIGLQTAGN